MDIEALPFNLLIGLKRGDAQSHFLVSLPDNAQYTNHLGTVHGSALLAVAEAGSGEFLIRKLKDAADYIPVVRKVEAKFKKPASGKVSAKCNTTDEEVHQQQLELLKRGRTSLTLAMEVVDENNLVVLTANIEWFITQANTSTQLN